MRVTRFPSPDYINTGGGGVRIFRGGVCTRERPPVNIFRGGSQGAHKRAPPFNVHIFREGGWVHISEYVRVAPPDVCTFLFFSRLLEVCVD